MDRTILKMSPSAKADPPTGKRPNIGMRPGNRLPLLLALTILLCRHLSAADPSTANSAALGKHWSFVAPVPVVPPPLPNGKQMENPIDALILAKLRDQKIKQVGPAPKPELLRRVTYDLTGLPPTTSELKAFLGDRSDQAWGKVVDRLLASPAFGERWAQHWLDLAHYADSNGFELDADRPDAWRYRDWVIHAFNEDMPYDRFLTLQVSGDESAPGDRDALIASGFARSGPREVVAGNIDPEVRRQDELTEATTTVGSVFLGLTLGCARCHDHKFDPLPTTDYYRLEAVFAGTHLTDLPIHAKSEKEQFDREMERVHTRTKPLEEAMAKLEAPYRERLLKRKEAALTPRELELRAKPKDQRTSEEARLFEGISVALKVDWEEVAAEVAPNSVDHEQRESLKRQIYEIGHRAPKPAAQAMAMSEGTCELPETWVLVRGNIKNKRQTVEPGPPDVLLANMGGAGVFHPPSGPIDDTHTGWRLALARWMVASNNPLTARVIVNRLWQHHFGRGLVATSSNFGTRGEVPANQALLDYLAAELVRNGWRLKPIHRLMLTSKVYQLCSESGDSTGADRDPGNRYLWRMARKRMDAEALRDSILAATGQLNRTAYGPGVLIDLEPEVRSLIFTEQEVVELWPVDEDPSQRCRRSIYVYRKRNVHYPFFDAFDAPDALTPCPVRAVSTHAPQALVMFNSGFAQESAKAFARLLLRFSADEHTRVTEAFLRCYARKPSREEMREALRFISSNTDPELTRWSDFALALINSNEFVYVP
ncbi:MAG: DUF1549 and DUF1553 domain-containing protein [Verrucomicrobiota bacterium]